MPGPYLTYKEIKLEDVPKAGTPELKAFMEDVQAEADAVLAGTEEDGKVAEWDNGKAQENGTVAMRTRKARKNFPDNGLKWHLRTSYHAAPSVETFRKYMQQERQEYIKQYMSGMKDLVVLEAHEDGQVAAFYTIITLGMLGSDREFAGVTIQRNFDDKHFQIITIPLSTKETSGGVKGLYSSVEDVREVQRGGKAMVQWRKASISDPRGSIPQFLSQKSVDAITAKDVTDFVNFLKKQGIESDVQLIA